MDGWMADDTLGTMVDGVDERHSIDSAIEPDSHFLLTYCFPETHDCLS